jgi:hypothetical protein
MEEAQQHALTEFERYRIVQDQLFQSDFDRLLAASGDLDVLADDVGGDADESD